MAEAQGFDDLPHHGAADTILVAETAHDFARSWQDQPALQGGKVALRAQMAVARRGFPGFSFAAARRSASALRAASAASRTLAICLSSEAISSLRLPAFAASSSECFALRLDLLLGLALQFLLLLKKK